MSFARRAALKHQKGNRAVGNRVVKNRLFGNRLSGQRRRRLNFESLENRRVLAAIASGQELTDSLAIGQTESFEFSLAQPGLIRVAVGQTSGAVGNPNVTILNASGSVIAGPTTGTDDVTLELSGQPSGAYTAVVSDANNDETLDYHIRLLTLPGTPSAITGRDSISLGNGQRVAASVDVGSFNFYQFAVPADGTFRLSVGQDAGAPGRPELTVFGPDGMVISGASSGTDDVTTQITGLTGGTYTAVVAETNNDAAMDYYLRLLTIPGSPQAIVGRDTTSLSNGSEISATVEVGGFNFHSFDVAEGGAVRFTVGQDADASGQPDLTVFNSSGAIVFGPSSGADNAFAQLTDLPAGTYTALVADANGDEPLDYRARLLTLPGSPAPITGRDQVALGNGQEFQSSLEIGGLNFHQFTLGEAGTFRVSVGQDLAAVGGPELTIFDSTGTIIAGPTRGNDDATIQLINQPVGTYTAVVTETNSDETLDYRIRLLSLPGTPTPIGGRDSASLSNGGEVVASTDVGSFNFHRFTLDATSTVRIAVGQDDGEVGQPQFTVFDDAGDILFGPSNGNDGVSAVLADLPLGTYTVLVEDANNDSALDYRIRMLALPGTPQPIAGRDSDALGNGEVFATQVSAGEFNFHRIVLDEPSTFRFSLGQDADAVGNPELTIYGPDGSIAFGPQNGTDEISFQATLADAGTYTAVVTDANSDSSMAYRVRLLVLPGTPQTIDGNDSVLLTSGQEVSSTVDVGGFHFHNFTVDSLSTARLYLGHDSGSLGQPELTVFAADGSVVRSAISGTDDISVELANLPAGDYVAMVTDVSSDVAMDYRLRLLTLPGTPTLLSARDRELVDGATVLSTVPVGSFTLFPFKATAGDNVLVRVSKDATTPDAEPRVDIFDSNGSLVISQGDTSVANASFTISENGTYYAIVTDGNNDEAMTFSVTASGNNAPPSTVTIRQASQVVDEDAGTVSFDIDLDFPSATEVTVPLALSGTATEGSDYTISTSTVTIAAGSSTANVTLSIVDDFDDEADVETAVVTMGTVTGAVKGVGVSHTLSINDNDDPPAIVSVSAASQEVDEDAGTVSFDILLSKPSPFAINIPFTLTGTATRGGDYTSPPSPITIAAGETSLTVSITVLDDSEDEADQETIVMTLETPDRADLGASVVHTVTINDNDQPPPMVSMAAASQSVNEDVGNLTFDVALTSASASEVTVPFTVSGTATDGSDFTLTTTSPLTFAAGSTTQTVTIAVADDSELESSETVIVTLGTPTGASLGTAITHTATIVDNEVAPPTVNFTSVPQASTENIGSFSVSIGLSEASTEAITIPFALGGTAIRDTDYTAPTDSFTIPAGATSATITVTVIDDAIDEPDETILITLGEASGVQLGTNIQYTLTVLDNDDPVVNPPTVGFSTASTNFTEATTTVVIDVELSATTTFEVTVPFTITGTATNGVDYTISSSPITIVAGSSTGSITVMYLDDSIGEASQETIVLTLGTPTGADLGTDTVHTLTITDNETVQPSVSFGSASQTVNEDAGSVTFDVVLSTALTEAVEVTYSVSGTAIGGSDFTITDSPITIPAGSTSVPITLNVIDDAIDETDQETVVVTITGVVGANLGASVVHTATIVDNDDPPLSVSMDVTGTAGGEGIGSLQFELNLSAVSTTDVSIPFTLSGTATDGSDFTVPVSPVTIAAGETSTTFTITVLDDLIDEDDTETVIINFGTPVGAVFTGSTTHTATISDDDAIEPTVSISLADQTASESDGTVSFSVVLSQASDQAITIPFTLGGTATLTDDFTITSSPLSIPAGVTSLDVEIALVDDDVDEADQETLVVTLGTPTGAVLGTSIVHTLTINDDDAILPTVDVSVASQTVSEDAGTVTFTVNLSEASDVDVSVPFTVTGTAVSGSDFTITASPVVITAGSTSATINVGVIDDSISETSLETVIVTLGTPTNANLGTSVVHTVSISDNEPLPPTVNVTPITRTEDEDVGTLSFDVTLSEASTQDVSIPFTLSGTATSGVDYTFTASPLTIVAGQTSFTAVITILNDTIEEDDQESIIVTLGEPTGATLGTDAVFTAIINDNDKLTGTVEFSASGQTVNEDVGTFTFDIVLSNALSSDVTIPFTLSGAATNGVDYTITQSPVTIPAGQTLATVTVVVTDDTFDEENERVIATLGTPTGATLGLMTVHTAIITDNDDSSPVVNIANASQSVSEDAGIVAVTVTLSVALSSPVSVPFTLSGTATSGSDYSFANSPIVIPEGVTTFTAFVTILEDTIIEDPETVVVTLGTPDLAALGSSSVHTITITDNDVTGATPAVNVSVASQSGSESVGTLTFNVTLSNTSATDVTIPFTVSGTATDGTDFTITGSPITITPGFLSAPIVITLTDDVDVESDETVVVTLGTPIGATLGLTTVHTATIVDDDSATLPTVNVSAASQSGSEDAGTLTFDVTLSAASDQDVTVPFTVTGTATSGDDFTITSSPVTILAGATTATVTISVVDDTLVESDETIVITLGTPTGATLGANVVHTATITDNEVAVPVVNISSISQVGAEGAGTFSFQVTLSSPSDTLVSVPFTVTGTAVRGADYAISASPINFSAGVTLATLTITITDDLIDEDDETVIITLGTPTGATLGTDIVHTLTIADNDVSPPVVNVGSVSQSVGEDVGTLSFDVVLSEAAAVNTSIPFTVSGTATDGSDFTIASSTATIAAGSTTATVTITIIDDLIDEVDETIVVTLGTSAGATLGSSVVHTATITDNDDPPPVIVITSGIPAGSSDDGIDGKGTPPTSWANQRSTLRVAEFDLGTPLTAVPTPADLTLTNKGVGGLETGTFITLQASQITMSTDLTTLTLNFDAGQLTDGVYELVIGSTVTGGEPIVITGTRENKFFVLTGDFNGSGIVDNRDFTTFAYWFLNTTPPEYVDLRTPVGINAQDFVIFLDHFGENMFPEADASSSLALSLDQAEGEALLASLVQPADVNGDGVVNARDALNVINRMSQGNTESDGGFSSFDANRDGKISAADALFVINRLPQVSVPVPEPEDDDEASIVDQLLANEAFIEELF
ncbi:Calx-beta domain protein [Rubripirellula amarantea]|uniref:Calx-beta domain protein n=1 Tax=Rubripirellula amarantea TaxID=2527999 RepID=A0A5C5WYA9_9BACT|nr:Calx-beta domain-containing protein [Rubripirellula amarantea]TWT55071.1 Calx-beta domain protein [Rubripirellula amarantea]